VQIARETRARNTLTAKAIFPGRQRVIRDDAMVSSTRFSLVDFPDCNREQVITACFFIVLLRCVLRVGVSEQNRLNSGGRLLDGSSCGDGSASRARSRRAPRQRRASAATGAGMQRAKGRALRCKPMVLDEFA
jgi:hypothetical protein